MRHIVYIDYIIDRIDYHRIAALMLFYIPVLLYAIESSSPCL